MIDGTIALCAARIVKSGKDRDAFEQRGFPAPFSPMMIVTGASKSSSKPSRRKGRQNG
jgi:hypothetical protein